MKKVKVISKHVVAVLLLVLLLASCGGKKAESTGAAAPTREPYELDIYTFSTGTFTYILGVAIADIINENHPWIQATAVESPGATPNEMMMLNADDYKRKHTIYYGIADNAYRGIGEFAGRVTTRSKIGFTYGLVAGCMVTANPNLTKIEDFAGKAVALRGNASPSNPHWIALIDAKVPYVKYEYLDFNSCVEANLAGAIDAWFCGLFSLSTDFKKWIGNPATVEFFSRAKEVSFIDLPMDVDKVIRSTKGGPFEDYYTVVATMPAFAADPRQTKPWDVALTNTVFLVDQDFPEDVLYEVMKIVGESGEKLAGYHPQAAFVSPKTMPIYTYPPDFHPGALKYFKEVGVAPVFLGDVLEQASK